MRTTVDLPPVVHERARQIAIERKQSLSAVLADLTSRGLETLSGPLPIRTDPVSGLPVVSSGRRVTSAEVADLIDEE